MAEKYFHRIPEKKKLPSNTGEKTRVQTPCGMSLTEAEADIHDCPDCRRRRAAVPDSTFNVDRGNDIEDVVNDWRKNSHGEEYRH